MVLYRRYSVRWDGINLYRNHAAFPLDSTVPTQYVNLFTTQHTPSSYLFEMKQTTEEKLAGTREMYPPKIIQLLDIGTSSHQKV